MSLNENEIIENYLGHLKKNYKKLNIDEIKHHLSPNMFSPFTLQLPKRLLDEAQEFISAVYKMREKKEYIDYFANEISEKQLINPGNKGICMSFDFHLDQSESLKLIEINTNAAFLALGTAFYESQAVEKPVPNFSLNDLKECIQSELSYFGYKNGFENITIDIVDEAPKTQRLYCEFLLYKSVFESWGWNCRISDTQEVKTPNFVYNRSTDFYFDTQNSSRLKDLYKNKEACFSPHPFEYFLLADKQRLIDWNSDDFWKFLNNADLRARIITVLPDSFSVTKDNLDRAWDQRKKLFFKPKRAFGSKQSYRGGNMSRRILEDMAIGDFIAQEYVPAREVTFQPNKNSKKMMGDHSDLTFKYDLRFYTYEDRIQNVLGRLYQGQTTNAKTLGGGFSLINFV